MAKQDLTIRGKPGRPKKGAVPENNKPKLKEQPTIKEISEQITKPQPVAAKKFKCCACGMATDAGWQYPRGYSALYAANEYRLPICNECINALYNVEAEKYKTYYDVYRRICMMFDLYYSDKVADLAIKDSNPENRMTKYCAKASLKGYANKTYADTIKEEGKILRPFENNEVEPIVELSDPDNDIEISQEVKDFWGFGMQNKQYHFLDVKYKSWLQKVDASNDPAYESILQNVCRLELQIQEAMADGGDISKLSREYNSLLGSLKLQPKQNDVKEMTDSMCFGNLIKEWEDNEPIPEPEEQFKDVDGIGHYISVWFLGHLCKMMGVKGSYDKVFDEYREEVAKYTVEKPEYDEEDEGGKFKGLFSPTIKEDE